MSQPRPQPDRSVLVRALSRPLAVGLLLRLAWILVCPNEPTSDQVVYHDSARWLVERLSYVNATGNPAGYWPVGYSALLAPFYALFGPHPAVAFVVNALLGGLTIVTTGGLAATLFGIRAGRAAAWVVALLPTGVLYTTCIASENAVLPGLMGAMWLMATPGEGKRRIGLDIMAGVVLAATTYVRGTALPFAAIPLALSFRTPWLAVRRAATVGACLLALTLPWAFRNHADFGTYSLTSINAGANLWMGNREGTDGMAASLPPDLPDDLAVRDAELRQRAIGIILADPVRSARLAFLRSWVTLRSDTIAASWNVVGLEARFGKRAVTVAKVACTLGYFALLGAAALGLFARFRARLLDRGDAVLALGCALIALPFVVIVGGNRYGLPLQPLLSCWAGFKLAQSRNSY